MAFVYDSNITSRVLLDDEVEIALDDDDTGELKSQVNYRDGEIRRKGYTVAFRRLAEAHGSLDMPELDQDGSSIPVPEDNASLLAVQIIPRTDSGQKRRFESLSITLYLEQDPSFGGNQNPPSLIAYEPAADGAEYFQECVTNVTKTSNYEASVGLKAPTAVEGTLGRNWGTEKSFEQRRRLKLSSMSTGFHKGIDTQVTFDLEPASGEDGIGDSLAVALIIERSPGTNFYIVAKTDAVVNARLKDLIPKGEKYDLQTTLRLGPFGPKSGVAGEEKCPRGVDTRNLRLASSNILKGLGYVHVAEKGREKLFVEQAGAVVPDPGTASKPACAPAAPDTWTADVKPAQAQPRSGSTARQPNRSLFAIQTSRAARHRLMASHHRNLAQLHLEEADEVEKLLEIAHSDQDAKSVLFQI